MPLDITRREGPAYPGRRYGSDNQPHEEERDVFSARLDYGASIIVDDGEGTPTIEEAVYEIIGSGESRNLRPEASPQWRWGRGTVLAVSRSSIPTLMRVLADILEAKPHL
jgi:hypothetical protein